MNGVYFLILCDLVFGFEFPDSVHKLVALDHECIVGVVPLSHLAFELLGVLLVFFDCLHRFSF